MTLNELTVKMAVLEEKQRVSQGFAEIAVGLARNFCGNEAYFDYLRNVTKNKLASGESKKIAKEILRQEGLWSSESFEGPKQ